MSRKGAGSWRPPVHGDGFAPALLALIRFDQDVIGPDGNVTARGVLPVPVIFVGGLAAIASARAPDVLHQGLHLFHSVVVYGNGQLAALLKPIVVPPVFGLPIHV